MIKHYLNLSNGIQAIKDYNLKEYSFIRIQSTHCENKKWDLILRELDYDFLMSLAIGYNIRVYDYSAHKTVSRALYQGFEWIRYVLHRIWFNESIDVFVRNHNCRDYFGECFKSISKQSKKKIKYFKKFLNTRCIDFTTICTKTKNDGKYKKFYEMLNA